MLGRLRLAACPLRSALSVTSSLPSFPSAVSTCPLRHLGLLNAAQLSRPRLRSQALCPFAPPARRCSEEARKEEAPSALQRFRALAASYWYVVVPVHAVASLSFFAAFYVAISRGVDVAGLLQLIPLMPDAVLERLGPGAEVGTVALAYALYKVISPLRYVVTVVLSSGLVRALAARGLLPTSAQLRSRTQDRFKKIKDD